MIKWIKLMFWIIGTGMTVNEVKMAIKHRLALREEDRVIENAREERRSRQYAISGPNHN